MDLRTVILGLLKWKPSSGYDLKRIISDSDVFYCSGNNNQIYKSLTELQKEGLVTHEVELQENLPAKKVYTITELGIEVLKRNLLSPPEVPELRNNFLIQLAWAEGLSDEELLGLLNQYEAEIVDRLRMVQYQADHPGIRPGRSRREQYLWKRIAENFIGAYQTELEWVRMTKQGLLEEV